MNCRVKQIIPKMVGWSMHVHAACLLSFLTLSLCKPLLLFFIPFLFSIFCNAKLPCHTTVIKVSYLNRHEKWTVKSFINASNAKKSKLEFVPKKKFNLNVFFKFCGTMKLSEHTYANTLPLATWHLENLMVHFKFILIM